MGFAEFDNCVYFARHFGRDGVGLATQMGIVPLPRDVALELVAQAIGAFEHCNLTNHPEGSAQSGVAVFGDAAHLINLAALSAQSQIRRGIAALVLSQGHFHG